MNIYETYGLRVKLEYGSIDNTLARWLNEDTWEQQEISAIPKIPKDSTVLELGGCIGITANVLNRELENPEKHVVVEPNPKLMAPMLRIRDDNGGKFQIRNCVIGIAPGSETFSFHPTEHITAGRVGNVGNWQNVQVEKLTIDDLEKIYNINFDCLVMDVEGAEYELFNPVTGWLKDDYFTKFRTIMIEFHNTGAELPRCQAIMDAIENAGYTNEDLGDAVRLFKKDIVEKGKKIKI